MTTKKLSVTIGISALNEEENIGKMLSSLLIQEEKNFTIEKILVISDGSTDGTVNVVRSFNNPKICVIASKKNLGRAYRSNQLMRLCKTDLLVILDSDISFYNKNTLAKVVKPFYENRKVALVSGNTNSVGKHNFVTRSWLTSKMAYEYIRHRIKNGNNVLSCFGAMLAIAKPLHKRINIPSDIFAWDSFLYLSCLKSGHKFVNVSNAEVRHPLTTTLLGQIKRNKRYSKSTAELKPYFGEMVDREFYIPRSLYYRGVLSQLLKYPIHTIFIYAVNSYARLLAKYGK
ncbi:hypothetical protein A2627_02350 [Candidatus Woesebacteria bacterium RIFCSPHIGHO2_01_FULL_39_28]|uniref:Glycosyltransferase 2-like domain-containing protein n=1 Tax=Candidatus Woesebacteria bacterium RIFCSPHIGHO2_01_FULL_39_28 TaxID=1802496 RepID=A0A1F7YF21_9BACT|nr:MAG: hypothetical protein A2627_02350 [Candidatus Woesebacteria bacterium RIFCSPHIGHO2_01_FULL_39_28]OGM58177.1 MAG: hypothetical protein A3A50_00230 [Candidatus Woesebacteria bacterium RIFCSPLOWO2_01_FULL_38_20]